MQPENIEQPKYKKSLSYYFRIDLKTIQGRLTGGFISMAIISFLLINGANYQWGLMIDNRQYLLQVTEPARVYTITVLDKVNEAQVAFEKGIIFSKNTEEYFKEYEDIWIKEVRSNRDSLDKYINKVNNNNLTVIFAKIDNQIAGLKREYAQAISLYRKRNSLQNVQNADEYIQGYVQANINPIVADLGKSINEASTSIQNIEEQYNEKFAYLNKLRPWIVFLEFVLSVALAAAIGSILISQILRRVRLLRDSLKVFSKGNIPENIPESGDELNTLIRSLNELGYNLREIKDFAVEVGGGKFGSDISVFNNEGELGQSLANMKDSLQLVYEQESRRTWATAGLAKFSEILRQNSDDINILSNEVISNLVSYVEINQGGIFLLNKQNKEPSLDLRAAYAFNKKKSVEKSIKVGEGLLGQAFLEGGVVYLQNIPQNYTYITSGLGDAAPRSLLIVPLPFNNEVIGMLELASFEEIPTYKIEFIKMLAEVVASSIATTNANDATRRLLQESQNKTEAIRLQEEQLRQNTEELIAAQEELEKNLQLAGKEIGKLKIILDTTSHAIAVYDSRGIIQLVNKPIEKLLGYSVEDIMGKNIKIVLGEGLNELQNKDDAASSRMRTPQVSVKQVQATKKDGTKIIIEINTNSFEQGREKITVATMKMV